MTKKMHTDEIAINAELVKKLLLDQFPDWADDYLTWMIPQGTDNAMVRLGEDKIVRLPRIESASQSLEKESRWLPYLQPKLPIAVPEILGKGKPSKDYPFPWLITRYIEGCNPTQIDTIDLHQAANDLGNFILSMHKIEPMRGPKCRRGRPLILCDEQVQSSIPLLEKEYDTKRLLDLWKNVSKKPAWTGRDVWMHGDLHAGNLLVKNKKLVGIVDFGLAGVGDPACDLMVAWTLLNKSSRKTFQSIVGLDADTWQRALGWALFLGIVGYPYYKKTNLEFASIAKKALDQVIEDQENGI